MEISRQCLITSLRVLNPLSQAIAKTRLGYSAKSGPFISFLLYMDAFSNCSVETKMTSVLRSILANSSSEYIQKIFDHEKCGIPINRTEKNQSKQILHLDIGKIQSKEGLRLDIWKINDLLVGRRIKKSGYVSTWRKYAEWMKIQVKREDGKRVRQMLKSKVNRANETRHYYFIHRYNHLRRNVIGWAKNKIIDLQRKAKTVFKMHKITPPERKCKWVEERCGRQFKKMKDWYWRRGHRYFLRGVMGLWRRGQEKS